jgi:hypothetical protein
MLFEDVYARIFLLSYTFWNVFVFFNMYLDKRHSQRDLWRIPEANLLFKGLILGAVGLYAGMKVFHHKTRNLKFVSGVPLLIVLNFLEIAFLYYTYIHLSARFI